MNAINYLKKHKIPYVLYINGGTIKKETGLKRKIKTHFIKGAAAYFSPDEASNKYLEYYGANPKSILNYPYSTIYENEIVKKEPNKAELRKELGISFDKVFVSAGQLIKRKNYLSLVENWQKFPENHGFFLIGDGKQRKEIEALIKEKNLENVVLKGFLPREEMFRYFRASDAFLFPSKEDIYGHVINEAMSQGLPVISTSKVNSATKLVKDGSNGYLLEKLEGELLRKAVNDVLKLNAFNACVKTAKENTIEKMAEAHVKMINEVLGK